MTSSGSDRLRIVVAEPSLARRLRDAGQEVIFIGADHTPEQLVATAIQEDVDVIGLASDVDDSLEGSLVALLVERGVDDIDVAVYGSVQGRAAR